MQLCVMICLIHSIFYDVVPSHAKLMYDSRVNRYNLMIVLLEGVDGSIVYAGQWCIVCIVIPKRQM